MKRLVILGGGYGGLNILHGLLEDLPKDVHIVVVDRNPYHSLKTEFYTIAAGTESDRHARVDFPEHDQVEYVFDEIEKIDVENEKVLMKNFAYDIEYDYLVIGLGCEDNYHGIEGAREFTESVQSFSQARSAGYSINNLGAYGKITIVGAGLSGIEVASEVRESRADLNIRLLDRGETVLKAFDHKIQKYVEKWFHEHDVEVIHNANVEYVERDGVCNNGLCYMNDVTVWTAGVQPNYLVRELPFDKDVQNKIIVNDYYQVPSHQNVYVVGDCASAEHSPSAQLAGQQGEKVAEVILAFLKNRVPVPPGEVKLKGALGSLGKNDGFGNMLQKPMTGVLPRLAKSGVLWLSKRH
ncbi:NAD(P)/FAD-dependent oxidoreductase [Halobacillus halophilus]|uniref:NAD(P)/FAD-dependent oxidoreductase n=1 Tax=Halobacillus halophilus TaxID=1570 RepID=UPI001CD1FFC2|nr:NAD(P)/FAD-dependent oxidoreductase [Halobacillus halophilus]MCA1010287.1 NAD(P)/FAD-dependent oxidoreductase [Halobacillus halophilus]